MAASHLIEEFPDARWTGPFAPDTLARAAGLLEDGCVLFFPRLPFRIEERERPLLSLDLGDSKSKNVSFDPRTGMLRGLESSALPDSTLTKLNDMLRRFSDQARALAGGVMPGYREHLQWGLTSFRPAAVAGRKTSWRKDDSKLHVDAFPSRPTQGRRILRVFTNVGEQPRVWRLGEPFEKVVDGFAPAIRLPMPGSAWMLERLGLVKGRRSPYDHLMLQIHNRMKADRNYQRLAIRQEFVFPPHSSWIVFTDQVSHAAISGQFALEQTLFLSPAALNQEATAPIRVLERKLGRTLA